MPNPTEPGWYPDARHTDLLRYWSGEGWTLKTKPAEPAAPAPSAAPPRVTPSAAPSGPGRVLRNRAETAATPPVANAPAVPVTPPTPATPPSDLPAYPGTHTPIPPAAARPEASPFAPYPGNGDPFGTAASRASEPYPASADYPAPASAPTPTAAPGPAPSLRDRIVGAIPTQRIQDAASSVAGSLHRSSPPPAGGNTAATEEYNEFWAGTAMYGPQLSAKAARVIRDNSAAGEMPWFVLQNSAASGVLVAFADRLIVVTVGRLMIGGKTAILPFSQVRSVDFAGVAPASALHIVSANEAGSVSAIPLTESEHTEALSELERLRSMVAAAGSR